MNGVIIVLHDITSKPRTVYIKLKFNVSKLLNRFKTYYVS